MGLSSDSQKHLYELLAADFAGAHREVVSASVSNESERAVCLVDIMHKIYFYDTTTFDLYVERMLQQGMQTFLKWYEDHAANEGFLIDEATLVFIADKPNVPLLKKRTQDERSDRMKETVKEVMSEERMKYVLFLDHDEIPPRAFRMQEKREFVPASLLLSRSSRKYVWEAVTRLMLSPEWRQKYMPPNPKFKIVLDFVWKQPPMEFWREGEVKHLEDRVDYCSSVAETDTKQPKWMLWELSGAENPNKRVHFSVHSRDTDMIPIMIKAEYELAQAARKKKKRFPPHETEVVLNSGHERGPARFFYPRGALITLAVNMQWSVDNFVLACVMCGNDFFRAQDVKTVFYNLGRKTVWEAIESLVTDLSASKSMDRKITVRSVVKRAYTKKLFHTDVDAGKSMDMLAAEARAKGPSKYAFPTDELIRDAQELVDKAAALWDVPFFHNFKDEDIVLKAREEKRKPEPGDIQAYMLPPSKKSRCATGASH